MACAWIDQITCDPQEMKNNRRDRSEKTRKIALQRFLLKTPSYIARAANQDKMNCPIMPSPKRSVCLYSKNRVELWVPDSPEKIVLHEVRHLQIHKMKSRPQHLNILSYGNVSSGLRLIECEPIVQDL